MQPNGFLDTLQRAGISENERNDPNFLNGPTKTLSDKGDVTCTSTSTNKVKCLLLAFHSLAHYLDVWVM